MLYRCLTIIFFVVAGASSAQDLDFVFRNDFRPDFEKTISATELRILLSESKATVLDVRLKEDFAKDPNVIPGANYLDPEELPKWLSNLNHEQEVVVYCVAGKWVSQKVAYLLAQSGIKVRSLEGGIEAWKQNAAR